MLGIFVIAAAAIACFSYVGLGLIYGIYGVIFVDDVPSSSLIAGWLVVPFRFIEYLIMFSMVTTIIPIIRNWSEGDMLPAFKLNA